MIKFSPAFIERLRSHFLLSEVIGKRLPLKKHGREYQALCPFHNEKSPSFTVNDEKGFFHCFGCGAHGDAIEFVKRYERLTYPEAIEQMAREAGITLPKPNSEAAQKAESEKTLYDVVEAACQWFEKQLQTPQGTIAKDYIEKRGLRPETIRQFRIGYAPEDRTALYQHLIKLGFPQALQVEAGLIILPDHGSPYDRFRGRVMFPIRSSSGKVVAFGGRLLASNDAGKHLPKYLNSPETPLFKKGELLFNLDQAKRPAREGNMVAVMEGYMDVVVSVQAGIPYAVATLGTAVTPEHLRLLWQLAKEPVMCLDGDAAGARAMMRAAEVALPLLKPGTSLRFAVLPKGEDPDSFVQKQGKNAFEKILIGSRRLSQILWEASLPHYKLDLPEGRAALDDALKKMAGTIADATVRQHYLNYFRKQLWAKQAAPQSAASERSHHIERMVTQPHSTILDSLVSRLLKTLLQFPALLHKSQVEETLSHLDIHSAPLKTLRQALSLATANHLLDDREAFISFIKQQLPDGMLEHLATDTLNLPYRDTLSEHDALLLWGETVHTYQIAHLEYELQEAQEALAQNMDESAYQRMVELQQAIQKARRERTFAPAETDVA